VITQRGEALALHEQQLDLTDGVRPICFDQPRQVLDGDEPEVAIARRLFPLGPLGECAWREHDLVEGTTTLPAPAEEDDDLRRAAQCDEELVDGAPGQLDGERLFLGGHDETVDTLDALGHLEVANDAELEALDRLARPDDDVRLGGEHSEVLRHDRAGVDESRLAGQRREHLEHPPEIVG
jgi:hypothetical protein